MLALLDSCTVLISVSLSLAFLTVHRARKAISAACFCIFPSWFNGFHGCRTSVHPHATSKHPSVEPPQTFVKADKSLSSSVSVPLSHNPVFALLQDGKEGYEKWRVENSWGDDRGNKGGAVQIPSLHLLGCRMEPALGSTPEMLCLL